MLYRRGRPTSVVLLLLMVVPQLSLPLSGHSPLGLHHLFRLVGAARGLVALGGVEVLQVRRGVGAAAAGVVKVGHRVGARAGAGGRASVWRRGEKGQGSVGQGSSASARPVPSSILTEGWGCSGGAGIVRGLTTGPGASKHLAALDQVVDGTVDLWGGCQCVCSCVIPSLLSRVMFSGAMRTRVGRSGSPREHRTASECSSRMSRTVELMGKGGGLLAGDGGAGTWRRVRG